MSQYKNCPDDQADADNQKRHLRKSIVHALVLPGRQHLSKDGDLLPQISLVSETILSSADPDCEDEASNRSGPSSRSSMAGYSRQALNHQSRLVKGAARRKATHPGKVGVEGERDPAWKRNETSAEPPAHKKSAFVEPAHSQLISFQSHKPCGASRLELASVRPHNGMALWLARTANPNKNIDST